MADNVLRVCEALSVAKGFGERKRTANTLLSDPNRGEVRSTTECPSSCQKYLSSFFQFH